MATELGQAYVQIIPSARGIGGSIQKQLDPEASSAGISAGSKIGSSLKIAAVAAVAAAGVVIGKTVSAAISEGANLEQSLGGVETLFKGSADTVKKYADEAYKTAGLSANAYMENVTGFSASLLQSLGGDTDKAADVANMAMIDMSDNANKMGTDMQDIQNAYQGFAKQNYTMLDNLKLGYGGTKSEMERLLADAQKLTGVKYDIDNLSDVYNAIHAVQEELDITGTTAKEAAETLSGSLSAMKGAWSNVLGKIAIGHNIDNELKALAQTTSTFLFGNFIPMISNIFKALPGAIVTFVKTAAPLFISSGQDIISSLINGIVVGIPQLKSQFQTGLIALMGTITEKLPEFMAKAVQIVWQMASGFLSGIPQMITSAGTMMTTLIQFLLENIPVLLNSGRLMIDYILEGILVNLPAIAESALGVLTSFINVITEYLPVFLENGSRILSMLIAGLGERLPELIMTVQNIAMQFITILMENLPNILSMGIEMLNKLLEGIISILPSIADTALSIISSLVTYLLDNLPQIVDSGIKILTQLIQTITNNAPKLASAALEIIVKLVNYLIANLPKIIDTGIQIVGKLAKGIIDNIPAILSACADIASAIFRSIGEINLWDAGVAIINGFVDGLKGAWQAGKDFVGSIGDWIKDNKGPIEYDRKLLIPAGQAIMGGFDKSLQDNFKTVQGTVSGMGGSLEKLFNSSAVLDEFGTGTYDIGVNRTDFSSISTNQSNKDIKTLSLLEVIIEILRELLKKDPNLILDSEILTKAVNLNNALDEQFKYF